MAIMLILEPKFMALFFPTQNWVPQIGLLLNIWMVIKYLDQ